MDNPGKISLSPWFEHHKVEDDGLDYYYFFKMNGESRVLLSANVPVADRKRLNYLYAGVERAQGMAAFAGFWIGVESVLRFAYFKKMAVGWRVLSAFGVGWAAGSVFNYHNAQYYGPSVSALLRKYSQFSKTDIHDIEDRKREYFQIDDREYTSYSHDDLDHTMHAHHGPQPDTEVHNSTWLIEMDKFLQGKENNLKQHRRYVDYPFEFIDKSYPTEKMAHDLFHKN